MLSACQADIFGAVISADAGVANAAASVSQLFWRPAIDHARQVSADAQQL